MVDFNPIRDLRSPEVDPFNVPAGQSTEEIEAIRLRLVLTREKTENIVKIIKNKGLIFKKDAEKIQELQRRLRKTIPRIPILRGDASVQGGSEEEVTRRSFGLDFNRFRRTNTTTNKPTKDPFPILDVIITAVLLRLGIKGTPQGANNITKFFRNSKTKTKDFIKVLEKEFARTKNPAYQKLLRQLKLSETSAEKAFSQTKGFNYFSKKAANIKVKPTLTQAQIKRQNIKNTLLEAEKKTGLFDKKVKVNRESFFNRGKVKNSQFTGPKDLFKRSKDELKKLLEKEKNLEKIIENLKNKNFKALQERIKKLIPDDKYDGLIEGGRKIKKQIKNNTENLNKFVEKDLRSSIDGLSSNDIAMGLNIDTRDREFIIITRDA